MIKIGVIGVGHLGKIHLKLLKEIPDFELVGFYDQDPKNAQLVSEQFGVPAFDNMQTLIKAVDAVDIVTPTKSHFSCAKKALQNFKHIFIEKPITQSVKNAEALIELVREAKVKAQVGHVERFNPAFLAAMDKVDHPMFIEGHRLAKWNPRGTDVSVVHDLMIHDLDIVLSLIKSPVKRISASGVAVASNTPDIANARIEFNNGCVANLTASRISMKNMRKLRFFQRSGYLSVDFLNKTTEMFNVFDQDAIVNDPNQLKIEFPHGESKRFLTFEKPKVVESNAIKHELEEFAHSILEDKPCKVTLEEATLALKTAHKIMDKVNELCVV